MGDILGVEVGGTSVGMEACCVCCAAASAVRAACVDRMLGLMVGVVCIFCPGNVQPVIANKIIAV